METLNCTCMLLVHFNNLKQEKVSMKTNAKKQQKMDAKKAKAISASIPPVPKAEVKPAEPVVVAKGKRTSHLKLGPALLARKATDAEILKAFTDSFMSRGCTRGTEWIAARAKIYMHIAEKKAALKTAAV